jgi:hypothetical protein
VSLNEAVKEIATKIEKMKKFLASNPQNEADLQNIVSYTQPKDDDEVVKTFVMVVGSFFFFFFFLSCSGF